LSDSFGSIITQAGHRSLRPERFCHSPLIATMFMVSWGWST
jgi:hypothetical protein